MNPGRRDASIVLGLFLGSPLLPASAYAQTPHTHQHRFRDAERWAEVFDDPERDAWQKPHEVIRVLNLRPDASVADIGAGTGYFAVRLATLVPKGRVYGVDLEPDMVRYLSERARREGLANIEAVQGTADDPRLPEKVDLILMVDVFHHLGDRERYFRNLHGSLEPDGRIAIIDFRIDAPVGPPVSARIAANRVRAELEAAGYRLADEHDFLPHQYFLVFQPAGRKSS